MITVLAKEGLGVRNVRVGWMFPDPRVLLKDPDHEIKGKAILNMESVRIGKGEVFVGIIGPVDGKGEIGEREIGPKKLVVGYGLHLARAVWQAPELPGLRAGITLNVSGWSSFPPHGFEREGKAPEKFYEVFHFFAKRELKWWPFQPGGILITRDQEGELRVVHVRDSITVPIRPGLHSVTAYPGCRLGYVWAYTAKELPEKKIDTFAGRYEEDA